MTYVPTKEIKIKERQDKFLKAQLEKEREQALLEEIEKTEKERVKKKGLKVLKSSGILDAYQGLLVSLCKYGLPTEDLYEFSALNVLKHEKKLKVQRKKELEERLKQRNAEKQLNPVRSRAVSNNAQAIEDSKQQILAAVSPAGKNRGASKRRMIGGSSVERPGQGVSLTNVNEKSGALSGARGSIGAGTQKRSKKDKAPAAEAEDNNEGEEQNPFSMENDSLEGSQAGAGKKSKKSKKSRKASAEAINEDFVLDQDEEQKGVDADGTGEDEAPKKKKKKRSKESNIDVAEDNEAAAEAMAEDPPVKEKKKKRRRDESEEVKSSIRGSQVGLQEAGDEPAQDDGKKKKKKRNRESAEGIEEAAGVDATGTEGNENEDADAPRKKKKKKKQAAEEEGQDPAQE